MAQRLKVAVICNNHFSKGNGNANSRIIGSVAFVNQARSAYIVTPDAENEDRYLFMPSKANNAPKRDGLAYRIEGCLVHDDGAEILTSRIAWESAPVTRSPNEALAAHTADNESRTAKQEGMDFLRRELADGARKPAQDVRRQATDAGITPKALRSAREALGI